MNMQIEGPYCPLSSHLQDARIPWVRSEETNIAETFKRQVALMRSPFIADDYADVERHHYLMFENGYER